MSTLSLGTLRKKFPGESDEEIARRIAKEYNYRVIVRYKSSGVSEYNNLGCCQSLDQVSGYMNNSFCIDPEIIYELGAITKRQSSHSEPDSLSSYATSCIEVVLEELDDDRDWSNMPDALAIIEAGNSGRTEEAIRLANGLREKTPDFDFSYNWLANLHLSQHDPDSAFNVIEDGLVRAKSKILLCIRMGDVYLAKSNIMEAAKWWIRSAILQDRFDRFKAEMWPYLAVVADAAGFVDVVTLCEKQSAGLRLSGVPASSINKLVCDLAISESEDLSEALCRLERSMDW